MNKLIVIGAFLICLASSITINGQTIYDLIDDLSGKEGFFFLTSPCGDGEQAYANCKKKTTNGCGASKIQVELLRLLGPINDLFTPCCKKHDFCYATCGAPNFQSSFTKCNNDFKSCMDNKCANFAYFLPMYQRAQAYSACSKAGYLYYKAVQLLGRPYYQESQNSYCSCYNPKMEVKPQPKC